MRVLLILAAAAAALPALSSAQQVGNGSNYQNPSAPNYQAPKVPPPPTYTLPPLPAPTNGAADATPSGDLVQVTHIEVHGVTAFKPAVIRALVAPYENRKVSSSELQSLRTALTRLYVDKGFINSGVLLTNQPAKEGMVEYQAIEGSLTRIDVLGKAHLSPHYVKWRVEDHVEKPLNISDLQYALRYVQEDQNVARLDASLGPGDAPGESVLRLAVEEQPRFSVGLGADNHHTSSTGANEGTAFIGARDLTGFGDELHATVARSKGDTDGSGLLAIPVTAHNASFQLYYSRSSADIVQQPFNTLDIDEKTRTYGFSLTVPLLDRLDNRVSLFVGAESDRSYTTLLGTPFSFSPGAQNGVSAVAAISGGVDWLSHGPSAVTDLRLTYKRGIDALGATIFVPSASSDNPVNSNPTGADGRFGLEQLQFIYIQRLNGFGPFSQLNDRAQLVARVSGQESQRPLLILEKFMVGGFDTVRGYSEDLLVRDSGVVASAELQLPVPGYRAEPNYRDLAFAPFIDYGISWDKGNTAPGDPLDNTTHPLYIVSMGLGLLWNPFKGLETEVYWGRGIANNFRTGNDPEDFEPKDLQRHGFYFAVNYVFHW